MSKIATVADVYIDRVVMVDQNQSVLKAVQTMVDKNIGAIIVKNDDGNAVGIFTERDLLRRVVGGGKDLESTKVQDVMTKELVCTQLDDELDELPPIMLKGNFRHLPVANGFNVVGILSIRDLFKYLYEKKKI